MTDPWVHYPIYPSFNMSSKCSCCDATTEVSKSVSCSNCKKTFKISCVDLTTTEARKINAKKGLKWSCSDCLDLGDDITSLKTLIISLQEQILQLQKSCTKDPLENLYSSENIIQELLEREKRKNNIIIFNAMELNDGSKQDQSAADSAMVADTLSALNISDKPIQITRLGKFDPAKQDKKRPIKLTFLNNFNFSKMFKNTKNLLEINSLKHIKISSDKTPQQMQLYKKVKEELDSRKSKGENVLLKHIKGIPRIVSAEQHNQLDQEN